MVFIVLMVFYIIVIGYYLYWINTSPEMGEVDA